MIFLMDGFPVTGQESEPLLIQIILLFSLCDLTERQRKIYFFTIG